MVSPVLCTFVGMSRQILISAEATHLIAPKNQDFFSLDLVGFICCPAKPITVLF